MLARKLLMVSIGGGAFVIPSFTGSYSLFGDEQKGYIELYSSGTLTFSTSATVDIFAVGGGSAGKAGRDKLNTGEGGSSGYTQTYKKVELDKGEYEVAIGSGGTTSAASGGESYILDYRALGGTITGGGSSGGGYYTYRLAHPPGLTERANAISDGNVDNSTEFVTSQHRTTRAFEEADGILYAGGGGCGGLFNSSQYKVDAAGKSGASGGGGNGQYYNSSISYIPTAGTANTGSGGGGGGSISNGSSAGSTKKFGAGGSGLVIVRWGY